MLTLFIIFICFNYCCGLNKTSEPCWQCEDGLMCIPRSKFCDGKSDCLDSSDENAQCRKLISDCLPPFFKCDYGACIRGNARCDGTFDCADGSDERNCYNTGYNASLVQTNIKQPSKVCRPEARELCDGWPHCPDGSDETKELCSSRPACPPSSYRCAYGACVHANARCNGLKDCVDGSDEKDCYRKVEEVDKCTMPTSKPKNSQALIRPYNSHIWLAYRCEPGYTLTVQRPIHMCRNGKWVPPPLNSYDNICKSVRQRSSWTSWIPRFA